MSLLFLTTLSLLSPIELLGHDDWHDITEDATLALQLTYVTILEPSSLLDNAVNHELKTKKLSRFIFYDAEKEQTELERRRSGEGWTALASDVARLKCKARPEGLPPLPFERKFALYLLPNC